MTRVRRSSPASWMSDRETSCRKTFICPVNHSLFCQKHTDVIF